MTPKTPSGRKSRSLKVSRPRMYAYTRYRDPDVVDPAYGIDCPACHCVGQVVEGSENERGVLIQHHNRNYPCRAPLPEQKDS